MTSARCSRRSWRRAARRPLTDPPAAAGTFHCFGYGSNLLGSRLRESCPSAVFVTAARLSGYRLAFTRRSTRWDGGVADIIEAPDAEVWGAVWRIPLDERPALDRQEGLHLDPPHYRRIGVTVTTRDGTDLECLAYQVATREAAHIAPSTTYLDTMLRGAAEVGLPEGYVEALEAVARAAPKGLGEPSDPRQSNGD